jgi:hypothetical protein
MTDSYSVLRERLHRKSHDYFVFARGRWDRASQNMFYGATDALLDSSQAAASYRYLVSSKVGANNVGAKLLACYGFLQALYVQQVAVEVLSRAVGLSWRANNDKRLKEIRDVRNRLSGHPARAGEHEKPRRLSSAIIPYDDITQCGFRGHVYYDDGFIGEDIKVDVAAFQKDNEERLSRQMQFIEKTMDEQERQFRIEQAARPFSLCFGTNFDYLVQRLHCDLSDVRRLGQAQAHARMIREAIEMLEKELTDRGFESEAHSWKIVFTGLDLLEAIMSRKSSSMSTQHEFDLMFDGLEKKIDSLRADVANIDAKLSAPISRDWLHV